MKLSEIIAAQPQEALPAATDALYAADAANNDRGWTLAQLVAFLQSQGIAGGGASQTQNASNALVASASNQGGWLATASAGATLDLTAAPDLWFALVANNIGTDMTVTLPSGSVLVGPTRAALAALPQGVSLVYNLSPASPAFMVLHTQIGTAQLAHVADADGTSTATLAASVDAIRDALVAAGLMAQS